MTADLYVKDPAEPSAICGNTWNVLWASTDVIIDTESTTPKESLHPSDDSNLLVIGISPKLLTASPIVRTSPSEVLRAILLLCLVSATGHRAGPAKRHFLLSEKVCIDCGNMMPSRDCTL